MKAKFIKNISEWGGSGFSMGSSIFPVNRGGQMNRGGFGGSNNLGGPNMMYTYEIKPLTRNLQPKPTNFEVEEQIHIGHYIEGQQLNKKDGELHRGTVLRVEQTEEGDIMYYVILCDETSTRMKIDPTTAVLLSGEAYVDPENGVRDISKDEADLQRAGQMKENKNSTMKAKLVKESMRELYDARDEWKELSRMSKEYLLGELSRLYRVHSHTKSDPKSDLIAAILDAKYGSRWSAESSDWK